MPKPIVTLGDDVLRAQAKEVALPDISSEKIQRIVRDMSEALRATSDGIGIAAPQIGVSLRIFIASEEALELPDDYTDRVDAREERRIKSTEKNKNDWQHYVFINPEIVKISKKKIAGSEGCLSVPGKYGTVARAEKVTVRAYDERGKRFTRGASGLFARLFQHETDHLNGMLFIDRAQRVRAISKDTKTPPRKLETDN